MQTALPLLAALAVAACGGTVAQTGGSSPGAGSLPDEGERPAATTMSNAEIEALFRARQDSARMHFTDAEVHFFTGMIGHHAQALVMSALAESHGASPAVQTLAARIINAQKDEIALMQQWLRDRGQTVPEYTIDGLELTVHGADHAMHMPGMLTQEQLRELDRARGVEFDRLFLTYMIQHHRGAVTMVHDMFATHGAGNDELAFKVASDIQVDQRTEIARMERMLSQLPARD